MILGRAVAMIDVSSDASITAIIRAPNTRVSRDFVNPGTPDSVAMRFTVAVGCSRQLGGERPALRCFHAQ